MERNNLKELLRVLEELRAEQFPDIPMQVINDIVVAQYDNLSEDDRMSARAKTTETIMQFLNDVAAKEKEVESAKLS